jgi:L-fuconolactonase
MNLIDAHHHLWDTNHLRYPLFDQVPALNRPFTRADFAEVAAANGVSQSICVEAASAGADGLAETRWLLEQAATSDVVAGLVVWAPIEQPNLTNYLDQITAWGQDHIVGIRRSFEFEPLDFACRPEVIDGIRRVGEYGYSLDLVLFHPALPATIKLVQACPQVQFVLDHLGKPGVRQGLRQPWADHIAELADFNNITCKLSGLTTEADHSHWTQEDLKPYIDHVLRCFGWDRILFGSDWPVCELAGGYRRWLNALNWVIADASEANQRKLFSENTRRIYQLTLHSQARRHG